MKKTRLLEIVREEIAFALREGEAEEKAAKAAALKAIDAKQKALDAERKDTMKGGALEEDQLNEIEQLAEMASIVQLKTQLEKQGKTGELEAVKAAEKATIDKLKQNPVFSGEGKNARLKGYVSALKKELKAEHDINLQDLLTKVMLDAEAAGEKFKDDIATNTIEKDAAAQVLGTEKGQRGRKADPNKPEKSEPTGKKGRPAGSGEKKAVRTPGDDGFDKVEYVDVEDAEGPSSKELEKDETAKELGSTPEEKKVKFNQFLASVRKNKEDKAKIDGILKLAKDKFKFTKAMLDDLKRAAGRGVE
jgi:hypothetical protein